MKKVLLSIAVVALLATSCKGKTEAKEVTKDVVTEAKKEVVKTEEVVKEGVKEVVDGVKKDIASALEGVTIPNFSNEAVTKNLTEYAQYAKNYVDAKGNLAKITGMAAKGASLMKQGKELASKLDASELTKYKSVLSQIQSKMAPSK